MTADAVGGVWPYALELARALEPVGIHITLATLGPAPSPAQRHAAAAIPTLELALSTFALEWMDDPWDDVARAGDWLMELERLIRPEVVHLNGYVHAALPFRAPVLVAGHSCVRSWDAANPGTIDPRTLAAYTAHVAPALHRADIVVTPSQSMMDALIRHYGPIERAMVVPNGRRSDRFAPARKEPFIFSAGRLWDRAKNVDAVVAVAPHLPWPTMIAGAASQDAGSTAATARSGHVRALGALDERSLAGWLGRASIFALPARYEPFGLLPLEAALAGCALVLGDIPSLREVWGDTADFVAPDDHDALARTIAALIASPPRLASRAAVARQRALTYSPEAMRRGYLEAYHVARVQRSERERTACVS